LAGLASPAQAAPTPVGACTGQVLLGTFTPALKDVEQIGVSNAVKLLADQTTKVKIAGDCSSATRVGDPINPGGGFVSPLTPKAVAGKLLGNFGCEAAFATPAAWAPNGKITFTMTQLNALAKPYVVQTDVQATGAGTGGPDTINLRGIVLKGAAVGGQVTGDVWFDPVSKTGGASGYNTGYELDIVQAIGCQDGNPNTALIPTVLIGGGAATSTSLIGSTAGGLLFTLGQ